MGRVKYDRINCANRYSFIEHAEAADSEEKLDFDDAGYPRLPDNILGLRLHRRKAILRQFMATVRRRYHFYSITMCVVIILWDRILQAQWSHSMVRYCRESVQPSQKAVAPRL
jgi:hypothetical protein